MKTRLTTGNRPAEAYALLIVMGVSAITCLILGSTISRTGTVANLNNRNNQHIVNLNAAEAAAEKAYARMAFDFQAYGLGAVETNLNLYRTSVPNTNENSYWGDFEFSNGQGQTARTYVNYLSNYWGALPSQYPGLACIESPVYRILSNVKAKSGDAVSTAAVQEDVLLALVPITTYAIFYNQLLEFSQCATMVVNGRVHANAPIYVGTVSGASLTFNGSVTASGTVSAPGNNGLASSQWGSDWRTTFNATPGYKTNVPSVAISIPMTNTYSLIDMPPAGESPSSSAGKERMYNKAHVVILVSNSVVTTLIRASDGGLVAGADSSPVRLTNTLASISTATNPLPFLTVTNTFLDKRENKTNLVVDVDVGRYGQWVKTNVSILSKFPAGSQSYPTILYVANNRTGLAKELASVRVKNGQWLPNNSGLGFTLATRNPLYVYGNYNATNNAHLHSTNTSSTVPAALMSDSLTILSTNWVDKQSTNVYSASTSVWDAAPNTTVNAAILTGTVKSTGTGSGQYSGGVHNLPRLLEDWSGCTLWLNTSIVSFFNSQRATNKFVDPGTYYNAPTRKFSFDPNFLNPAKQPPGIPCALLAIRYNWAVPPANTVTYNAAQ